MSQSPQPPPDTGDDTNPSQTPTRQGILLNPGSNVRPRMNSIIPPPEDFEDEEFNEAEEKDHVSPEQAYLDSISGRWGEGPSKVNVTNAERDFRQLERTITAMSRGASITSVPADQEGRRKSTLTAQDEAIRREGDYDYEAHLKEKILPGVAAKGIKIRTMGVSWSNLTVIGEGTSDQFIKTTGDPFVKALKIINPVRWYRKCTGKTKSSPKKTTKTIIYPMDGYCNEGEMVLVLGRPGSGCSTLLRVLANDRKNYKEIQGEVKYNNLSPKTVQKHYKGEVLYNQEDDFHYPILTVRQTLETATRAKTPRARLPGIETRADFREMLIDMLTKMYGLTRQKETKVGNAFIRGLSGGERKRLSIAEQVATRSSVNMWDGSTRGLDASSALDYVKSLRVSTNLLRRSTFVSIYQASENIYDLFDKVLVLYDGHCIYFGPAEEARQYFIDMGFYCPARQTTADFLTAVTDPHERKPADGLDAAAAAMLPASPEQFEEAYKSSPLYERNMQLLQEYRNHISNDPAREAEFIAATAQDKQKHVSSKDPYMITYWNQVWGMTIRQVQLVKGDMGSLVSRYISMLIKAAIVGTTFLLLPMNTDGGFTRGGVLFFSLLFNSLIAQAELPATLMGRPILYKLKNYAMYRPSTYGLAQVVLDIPIILVHILLFSFVVYFCAGLQRDARKFFIFVFILTLASLCMTSFFRAWQNFDYATKYSGVMLLCLILYTGYLIPYQSMRGWFIWIFWINPLAYAYKALISNEFDGLILQCTDHAMVPRGPGYDNLQYQVCAVSGSQPGEDFVRGPDYLMAAFRYDTSQKWIDIVAVICFWVLFTFLTVVIMEVMEFGKGGFSTNVFKRPKHGDSPKANARVAPDVERGTDPDTYQATAPGSRPVIAKPDDQVDIAKGSIFTWEDLDYVVPYPSDPSGKKQLLNKIAGLVKPGTMTALMGSSGAGKTTLLDVLAQRKTMGWITGTIEVDGQPLRKDFQRTTGYCEQLDVHVPQCTVREAMRFSAHLRQPVDVPESEKDAYVEEIINILEMEGIADALIGTTESGFGISVEERKRLTIGVELVAKPKLLFLDEPTSGLDAQASYHIMKFMRRLTDQGQAILCTIHQPSSQLFAFFDNLLLLAKGGRTVFFGELGHDSSNLIHYFEKNGAPTCAADANPAEYILDVVNAKHSDLDWPDIWNNSPEKAKLLVDIKEAHSTASKNADHSEELEFATPTIVQLKYVFKRMFRTYWRCPDYLLDRLFMLVIFALLNAFTFIQLGHKLIDLQSRIFVIFQIMVMAPLICNTVEPRFQTERLWFFREQSGKYYSWLPFAITIIIVEIPFIIFTGTIFFLILYWCVGFSGSSEATIYTYLMVVLFTIFAVTLGQMIASWTPNVQIAALLNPFIISILNLFCGVVMPYFQMPGFWRSWMYWLDPYHYIVEGIVVTQLNNVAVICSSTELSIFHAPPGQTCNEYAGAFIATDTGYLNNPDATGNCEYCPYTLGQQYFEPLNMFYVHRWRNLGIFSAYILFNIFITILGVRFFKG
ncbi:hypothetical protein BGZ80_010678 [Entomortierella chlamydospora]|uniref:ABC transporter domain-containing protein n=1 Tax=Entomortierella chlamydospora TaxID=101097 RepID=A0A9P6N456_9FUNG|nr:hypothetical protein BGZ80_010678 [Entomortierella chlamydospora]